jgi:hypothetical protein
MKYSVEGFVWEAVDCVPTWEAACLREIALIKEYDARNPLLGYNLTGGGDGALGLSPPQKSRAKISSSLKAWHASGDPKAAALRDKVSQTRKTFPTSLETRLKKAADGRRRRGTFSPESCAKLSASKRLYSDAVVTEVTAFALEHGFRAAERKFGIPRPTIRRWTHSPEKKAEENRKMRERAYTKQYGYAFRTIPLVTQDM